MKIEELIQKLESVKAKHGNVDVFVQNSSNHGKVNLGYVCPAHPWNGGNMRDDESAAPVGISLVGVPRK
jgi:hypothetical protein